MNSENYLTLSKLKKQNLLEYSKCRVKHPHDIFDFEITANQAEILSSLYENMRELTLEQSKIMQSGPKDLEKLLDQIGEKTLVSQYAIIAEYSLIK